MQQLMFNIAIPNSEYRDLNLGQFQILEEICKPFRKKEALVHVNKVRDRHSGEIFCLKKMELTHKADLELFANELRVLYTLHHQSIVKLLGHFEQGEHVYALYELVERPLNKESKTITIQDSALVVQQLCQALEYLHSQQFIHRDVNIKNILLNRLTSTGPLQIKLIDFEFAARLSALRKTQLGTLASLSPEVANETFQDEKIDVWGVGVILFNLLTKTQPFLVKGQDVYDRTIENIRQLKYVMPMEIDQDARDLICKIFVLDPKLRISVSQILKHEFIRKFSQVSMVFEPSNEELPKPIEGGKEQNFPINKKTEPKPQQISSGNENSYHRQLQEKIKKLQQSLLSRRQDKTKPKQLTELQKKLNTLEQQFKKAQEENDNLKYRLKQSELSCLKLEKEKRAMDEHKINLEKSKLQHSKILSNVQRVTEQNSKIQIRLGELEKELVKVQVTQDKIKKEEARINTESGNTDRQRHVYIKQSPSQNRLLSKDKKSGTPLAHREDKKRDQSRSAKRLN